LLAWADELEEIKTICHSGRKATMTVRVDEHGHAVNDGPQVEIGGNERYVSVSRAEFKKVARGEGAIAPMQAPLPLGRGEPDGGEAAAQSAAAQREDWSR
jgi:thymidine kinase